MKIKSLFVFPPQIFEEVRLVKAVCKCCGSARRLGNVCLKSEESQLIDEWFSHNPERKNIYTIESAKREIDIRWGIGLFGVSLLGVGVNLLNGSIHGSYKYVLLMAVLFELWQIFGNPRFTVQHWNTVIYVCFILIFGYSLR